MDVEAKSETPVVSIHEESINEANEVKEAKDTPVLVARRPDIDVLRITLTWGILLFHTALIYTPFVPYYLKIFPENIGFWQVYVTMWFMISMNVWNMPMFFFLSGISAFFALKKRTEKQFRTERVHRLLVPSLFLALTASYPLGADMAAVLSPNCQELYYNGSVVK